MFGTACREEEEGQQASSVKADVKSTDLGRTLAEYENTFPEIHFMRLAQAADGICDTGSCDLSRGMVRFHAGGHHSSVAVCD